MFNQKKAVTVSPYNRESVLKKQRFFLNQKTQGDTLLFVSQLQIFKIAYHNI